MLSQTVGLKTYTLEKMQYDIVGGAESLYLQFSIEQYVEVDGENVLVKTYGYGFNASQENMDAMLQQLGQGFAGIVIQKLFDEKA